MLLGLTDTAVAAAVDAADAVLAEQPALSANIDRISLAKYIGSQVHALYSGEPAELDLPPLDALN
jgi:hypothetical protein